MLLRQYLLRADALERNGIWVSRPSPSRLIYIENSEVIFAKGRDASERLDSFLIQKGILTSAQVSHALSKNNSYDSLVKTLLALGFLSPERMRGHVQEWIETILRNAINDKTSSWSFESVKHAIDQSPCKFPIGKICYESYLAPPSGEPLSASILYLIRQAPSSSLHEWLKNDPIYVALPKDSWLTLEQIQKAAEKSVYLKPFMDYLNDSKLLELKPISESIDLSSGPRKIRTSFSKFLLKLSFVAFLVIAIFYASRLMPITRKATDSGGPPLEGPIPLSVIASDKPQSKVRPLEQADQNLWAITLNFDANSTVIKLWEEDLRLKKSLYIQQGSRGYLIVLGPYVDFDEANRDLELLTKDQILRSNGLGIKKFSDLLR